MKILVFSDSHKRSESMLYSIEKHKKNTDLIIHLGDGYRDADRIAERFPQIPLLRVPGNGDFGTGCEYEKQLTLCGVGILLCHGHTRGVKSSTRALAEYAKSVGASLALYGHTHRAADEWENGVRLFNPGTVGGIGGRATYGVVELTGGVIVAGIASAEEQPF